MKKTIVILIVIIFMLSLTACNFMTKRNSSTTTGETTSETNHVHTAGDPIELNSVNPTCEHNGGYNKIIRCTYCNKIMSNEYVDLPALGHDLVFHQGKDSTCTEDGYYDYYTCTRCDYTSFTIMPSFGHYTHFSDENYVPATCTEPGSYDRVTTCFVCGEELDRENITINALGHNFVHNDGKEPTCLENGYLPYTTCSRCDYSTYTIVPAKGHMGSEPVIENMTEPTCVSAGGYDLVVYCAEDNVELSREHIIIDMIDHDYINHEGKESTCTEHGYLPYRTCSRCDYNEFVELPLKEHSLGNKCIENIIAPADESDGSFELVSYCTECGLELMRDQFVIGNSENIVLNTNNLRIFEKESFDFLVSDDSLEIEWIINNDDIAIINDTGKLESLLSGELLVFAIHDGEFATAYVSIVEDSIVITANSIIYYPNNEFSMTVVSNSRNDNSVIEWTSSNEDVAQIDSSGNVTALNVGITTIRAQLPSGKYGEYSFEVKPHYIELKANAKTMYINDSFSLLNNSSAPETIAWSSSDTNIVTVSQSGVITAKALGTATITASSEICGTYTCKITVTTATITLTKNNYSNYLSISCKFTYKQPSNSFNTGWSVVITVTMKNNWTSSNVSITIAVPYHGTNMSGYQTLTTGVGVSSSRTLYYWYGTQTPTWYLDSISGTVTK